jgi:hypothetical protein
VETVREILAAHGSGISKPGLLAWARLRIDTKMTDAQLDEELARLGDEVVDVDGFLYLRSVRERALEEQSAPNPGAPRWGVVASQPDESSAADAQTDSASDDDRSGPWEPGAWSPPPTERRRFGGVGKVIGLVFVAFWVFGLIGNFAEGFFAGWTESATPEPTQPVGAEVAWTDLGPGDCFTYSEEGGGTLRRVPCDELHGYELFAAEDHPGVEFPGESAFATFAEDVCRRAFAAYTGGWPEDQPALTWYWWSPSEAEWSDGIRTVSCMLALEDGSLADTSFRSASP